jgi:hypothetical protein
MAAPQGDSYQQSITRRFFMAERENLSPGLRFKILVRDNFKCVYCGKTKDEERIDVDHVIPVASGGTNDPGNLVAACWTCNIGKSKSHVIPVTAEDEGVYVRKKSPGFGAVPPRAARDPDAELPLAVWVPKFQEKWSSVEVFPEGVEVDFKCDGVPLDVFKPSMECRGSGSDMGEHIRVLIVPWRPIGAIAREQEIQIRNAVISGYKVPTLVIMGTPSIFFAVLINERYKGCPRGRVVHHFLEPHGNWEASGWYPDENLDFQDLREPYRCCPSQLQVMDWDFKDERFFGVYSSFDGMGVKNGL